MKPLKVLIMVDWQPRAADFPFLRNQFAEVRVVGARFPQGAQAGWQKALFRWTLYVWVAFKTLLLSKKYDVIASWQPTCALALSFFFKGLGVKPCPLVIQNFIYTQKGNWFYARLRYALVTWALSAIDYMGVYTRYEIRRLAKLFGFPQERIICIPQGVNLDSAYQPGPVDQTQPYIFAAGMSLRDYKTLIDAVRETHHPVVIVCQEHNVRGLDLPGNVKTYINIWGEKVKQLRRAARLVVVPLLDEQVSAGQYDILYAMSEGKAVIATKTVASVEHITDGYDGYLTPCRDVQALKEKIHTLMHHPQEIARLGRNARITIAEHFTFEAYQRKMAQLLETAVYGAPGAPKSHAHGALPVAGG